MYIGFTVDERGRAVAMSAIGFFVDSRGSAPTLSSIGFDRLRRGRMATASSIGFPKLTDFLPSMRDRSLESLSMTLLIPATLRERFLVGRLAA